MKTKSILVPLDGSRFGEAALPVALSLAREFETGIEFVSVYEDEPRVGGWLISAAGAKDWYEEYHRDVVSRITGVSEVPVRFTVARGAVPKTLSAYIERNSTELTVMATHGRGPLSRAWLGSVADHVMRHVTCPVCLIRPREQHSDILEAPPFRRILVPLDGSDRAEQSVQWALRVGHDRKATYVLLRTVPPLFPLTTTYLPHAAPETRQILERGQAEAEAYLAMMSERLQSEELCVETDVMVGVQAGWGIVHYAAEHDCDLTVIATHGRGGLPRLVLGSVADKVVRSSSIPVLVHRPKEN